MAASHGGREIRIPIVASGTVSASISSDDLEGLNVGNPPVSKPGVVSGESPGVVATEPLPSVGFIEAPILACT